MGNRLYVGNLPYNIDEVGLRAFFGDGVDGRRVTQVKIVTDRETGRPRGFAFVELDTSEHARQAIDSCNGQQLGGRTIVVNEAREPPGRGGGGGGGGDREHRGGGGGGRGGRRGGRHSSYDDE
jgi:RNA recognition motif-containing protein